MAHPIIDRGVSTDNNLRDVASERWPEIIRQYRWFCLRSLPRVCLILLRFMDEGQAVDWAGYGSREAYLAALGLQPDAAEWAVQGLAVTGVAPVAVHHAARQSPTLAAAHKARFDRLVTALGEAMDHGDEAMVCLAVRTAWRRSWPKGTVDFRQVRNRRSDPKPAHQPDQSVQSLSVSSSSAASSASSADQSGSGS